MSISNRSAAASHAGAPPPAPTLTTALQTAWQQPLRNLREVDDDRYGHTLQAEINGASGRVVRVLNTLRYQAEKQERFMLLFVADPDYSLGCRPCYSSLGLATWVWQDRQWLLERTQRAVPTGGFLYDRVPQGSFIQLGKNNFGVLFREEGRSDYTVTARVLIIAQAGPARNPWRAVFDEVIAKDNTAYCRQSFAPAEATCLRYEGALRVEPYKSARWGTLLLDIHGQLTAAAPAVVGTDGGDVTPYQKTQRFRFDGYRYLLESVSTACASTSSVNVCACCSASVI